MPMQTAANVWAALKREATATPGVAASGAGALMIRLADSPGLTLTRNPITSNERRSDQIRPMGRLGGKSVAGSYNCQLTLGGETDSLFEAGLRRVWQNPLAITPTEMAGASITVATTSTITASAGSWIAAGIKVGDIITPTGLTTPANNNLRLRVVNVTTGTLTFAGTPLTVAAVQAAGWTLTRLKKLTTAGLVTRYSYTIEQYDADIDLSEIFLGCRLTGIALSYRPNAISTVTYTFMGMDQQLLVVGTSPWFANPVTTTGEPLIADDSYIRYAGAEVTKFTALDLNIAIAAAGQPVIGSLVSPDIFDTDTTITGSIAGIREDFSRLQMFGTEAEFEISGLFTEPATAISANPGGALGCFGIYMPRVKFSSVEAPFRGGEGPKIETLNLMVGPRVASNIYDASAMNVFSSAA